MRLQAIHKRIAGSCGHRWPGPSSPGRGRQQPGSQEAGQGRLQGGTEPRWLRKEAGAAHSSELLIQSHLATSLRYSARPNFWGSDLRDWRCGPASHKRAWIGHLTGARGNFFFLFLNWIVVDLPMLCYFVYIERFSDLCVHGPSQMAQWLKNPPTNAEDKRRSFDPDREDPLKYEVP